MGISDFVVGAFYHNTIEDQTFQLDIVYGDGY